MSPPFFRRVGIRRTLGKLFFTVHRRSVGRSHGENPIDRQMRRLDQSLHYIDRLDENSIAFYDDGDVSGRWRSGEVSEQRLEQYACEWGCALRSCGWLDLLNPMNTSGSNGVGME